MMWLGSHFVLFHVMFLLAYQNYSINPSSGVIVSLGEFYGLYLTSHSLMIAIVLLATPVVALIVDRLATHDTPRRPNHRSLPRMTKVHKAHSQPNVYEEDQELLNIERALVKLARENKVQMPTSKMRESLSLNLTEDEFQSEWLEREQSVSH